MQECSEEQLKKITGGASLIDNEKPVSNIVRCVFSLLKKCYQTFFDTIIFIFEVNKNEKEVSERFNFLQYDWYWLYNIRNKCRSYN
ncbi:EntF family bacteriocin induction factor [Enterococcus faecalis]|uniref:EntF family bacteriocin induction factor n=1 Tax=Enterococcus faecalis TaxID=1351 RepID=UPI000CD7E01F|nr:EntF family bacteriocin induction factor [Enterococcus faecalis]EGO2511148.1 EntF family bacteriocin induction factor [Enterococcus faecalis]EHM3140304.1 EntF family bacteriocin induction factor [Enterococcus faecalis]